MPREPRLKCVGCDKGTDSDQKRLVGGGLWKFFLSARALKRICSRDPGRINCRLKYLNWLKKVEGDFDFLRKNEMNDDLNLTTVSVEY